MNVCPTEAIKICGMNGRQSLCENRCVDCGECSYKACPVRAIFIDQDDF
ncbi:MAG: hypothetical protein U0Z17_05325 [Bacteroidales bacterium]